MATQNQTVSFTRPENTTPYTAGDLVANSATAGEVVPLVWGYGPGTAFRLLRQVRVRKGSTSLSNASFRLWLFKSPPVVTNGDNGALAGNFSAQVVGIYEGSFDYAASNGAVGWLQAQHEPIYIDGPIYGLLEARGAYTPGNGEPFDVTLEQADV